MLHRQCLVDALAVLACIQHYHPQPKGLLPLTRISNGFRLQGVAWTETDGEYVREIWVTHRMIHGRA